MKFNLRSKRVLKFSSLLFFLLTLAYFFSYLYVVSAFLEDVSHPVQSGYNVNTYKQFIFGFSSFGIALVLALNIFTSDTDITLRDLYFRLFIVIAVFVISYFSFLKLLPKVAKIAPDSVKLCSLSGVISTQQLLYNGYVDLFNISDEKTPSSISEIRTAIALTPSAFCLDKNAYEKALQSNDFSKAIAASLFMTKAYQVRISTAEFKVRELIERLDVIYKVVREKRRGHSMGFRHLIKTMEGYEFKHRGMFSSYVRTSTTSRGSERAISFLYSVVKDKSFPLTKRNVFNGLVKAYSLDTFNPEAIKSKGNIPTMDEVNNYLKYDFPKEYAMTLFNRAKDKSARGENILLNNAHEAVIAAFSPLVLIGLNSILLMFNIISTFFLLVRSLKPNEFSATFIFLAKVIVLICLVMLVINYQKNKSERLNGVSDGSWIFNYYQGVVSLSIEIFPKATFKNFIAGESDYDFDYQNILSVTQNAYSKNSMQFDRYWLKESIENMYITTPTFKTLLWRLSYPIKHKTYPLSSEMVEKIEYVLNFYDKNPKYSSPKKKMVISEWKELHDWNEYKKWQLSQPPVIEDKEKEKKSQEKFLKFMNQYSVWSF